MGPRTTRNLRPAAVFRAAAAACALLAALAGCAPGDAAPKPVRRFAPAQAQPAAEKAAPLNGRFRASYPPPESDVYALWRGDFRKARFLEDLSAWLDGWIALPGDVTLVLDQCGEPNAFYEPEDRSVVVCYELVEELDQVFADEEHPEKAVDDALVFTVMHEVGHALVHLLELPITGREEDAVDQLAALMLIDGTEEGDLAAINGVRGLPEEQALDDVAFADEHALSGQRYYNVLCMVYGQDPEGYAQWVEEGILPEERAERCPAEFEQIAWSWNQLLGPWLKHSAASRSE